MKSDKAHKSYKKTSSKQPAGKKRRKASSVQSRASRAKNTKKALSAKPRRSPVSSSPATSHPLPATPAEQLSAQVAALQEQISALRSQLATSHPPFHHAVVAQREGGPLSDVHRSPLQTPLATATEPAPSEIAQQVATLSEQITALRSQLATSHPLPATAAQPLIYELKEARPVGYQSSDLLDSFSEESQDGFFTGLLDRARMQWLMGDWDALSKLELEQIEHHPARAKLALLAAASRLQTGQDDEAKAYIRLAQEWGVNKNFIKQILIAGVHNSIGRAAAIGKRQQPHFENAIAICSPGADTKLLTQTRTGEQIRQLGLDTIGAFENIKVVSINNYEKKVIVQSNDIIKNENFNHLNLRIRQLDSEMAAIEAEKENLEKQKQSKYYDSEGYKEKKYWDERHEKFGFNIQGVGNKKLSQLENHHLYHQAGEIFLSLCKERNIKFSDLRVLDVGCGIGYYANLLKNNGVTRYLGVDISNVLFDGLKSRFPQYEFRQCDITNCDIIEKYDLIIMIDVTQHIVNASKFSMAMQNIKRCLSDNGIFIVTSWLKNGVKNSVYELSRDIRYYQREFSGWVFSDPKRFRDKYIFSVRRDTSDVKS
jgi:SAM-dependent methyltransferase